MEAAEKASGTINETEEEEESSPPMSKKEAKEAAKAAAKQEEKLAKKAMKKKAKRMGITVEELEAMEAGGSVDEDTDAVPEIINAEANKIEQESSPAPAAETPSKITAEERIRKERPPPRIRIMESSQPDYSALRLENIALTFRDQPVLSSATWGVQTGDRVGLVGANGAGKTTQLRIMAGELEPTAGDLVKSRKDLRVAMLRQEFIDEIDLTRTLREEFMSVFTEEAEIVAKLREAEEQLGQMTGDDADEMQEVLDRMTKLQNKADDKNVNALDSRVSKIMDLMGFDPEEGDYAVSMFSGGWKMRIGLGKVLLQDPNILVSFCIGYELDYIDGEVSYHYTHFSTTKLLDEPSE